MGCTLVPTFSALPGWFTTDASSPPNTCSNSGNVQLNKHFALAFIPRWRIGNHRQRQGRVLTRSSNATASRATIFNRDCGQHFHHSPSNEMAGNLKEQAEEERKEWGLSTEGWGAGS